MLTVCCIRWGDKYGDDYVWKLQNMAFRYLPRHRFVCFTDRPVPGVPCDDLPSALPGWWSKVALFRQFLFADGPVLYLDLDVVITESLQPFFDAYHSDPMRVWALDDFGYPLSRPRTGLDERTHRLLGGEGTINSSCLLWQPGAGAGVWDDFRPEIMDELHGDQNWITQRLWPDELGLLPDGVAGSWKYGGGERFPLTVFHGKPKNHEVGGWVEDAWR